MKLTIMLLFQNVLIMLSILAAARKSRAFQSVAWQYRRKRPTRIMTRLALSTNDDGQNVGKEISALTMENLYREWTLEQDELLWNNRDKASAELASLLGRGLRGVEARLNKLQDVSSPAYERLFANPKSTAKSRESDSETKSKLVPAGEILRRIEWDYMLSASDFSILHYDRLDDMIMESPLNAPNESISGSETLLSKALPEHRIVGVKYKDRVVWDRQERLDLVFNGEGIYQIIEMYDEWKRERDQVKEWNRQRQKLVAQKIRAILGLENFSIFQSWSSALQEATDDETVSMKSEVESFVKISLGLFRKVREDPSQSIDPSLIPTSDVMALENMSELVATLPDVELRSPLLTEISFHMGRLEGRRNDEKEGASRAPVMLSEDDLSETFVRGSGAGGQKVNKTSNRVILVHEPTQLRVECQDTRSLQQNRKIARKRLTEKLDKYVNGKQSKVSLKHQKAAEKRQKSKTKNRARQRKKQLKKKQKKLLPTEEKPVDDFY